MMMMMMMMMMKEERKAKTKEREINYSEVHFRYSEDQMIGFDLRVLPFGWMGRWRDGETDVRCQCC